MSDTKYTASQEKMGLSVLSLFDGISCGMEALKRNNTPVKIYNAYEIEPNAIKISQKNHPEIIQCGSVIDTDFTKYKGYDLLIGGSPCQSLSITRSKDRTHLEGKSKLFWEYVRALEEVQPKYFLFENVASMNEESKDVISEALGCQPVFIDSAMFSAQTRERLYWTNIPLSPIEEIKPNTLVVKDILQENVPEKYYYNCDYDMIGFDKVVCAKLHLNGHDLCKRVNSPYQKCQTLTCISGGNQHKKTFDHGRIRKLTPLEYERLQTLPDNYTYGVSDTARYTAVGNGWTVDVIAYLLKNITY